MYSWYVGRYETPGGSFSYTSIAEGLATVVDSLKKDMIRQLKETGYFNDNNVGDRINFSGALSSNGFDLYISGGKTTIQFSNYFSQKISVDFTQVFYSTGNKQIVGCSMHWYASQFDDYVNKQLAFYLLEEDDIPEKQEPGVDIPILETEEDKKRKADIAKIEKYTALYGEYCIKRNQLQKMITNQFLIDGGVDKLEYCKFAEDKKEEIITVDGVNVKIFTSANWKCFISNASDPVETGDMKSKYYVGYIGSD